ncbi:hypothetical protein NX722_16580 [Endozoicomonas gorgoniicola]|uniref:CheW-like domain-containing protein n=1 Tax=Endozoicomonas gorgoniicola TaxID=1234144 RepID=A0ABT3MXV9_9GAMM|nr:hypothetical protein [Endozoicomonas gorgoniicola]MCW7554206.1 hypothetical protein [Endozoicomonas gorgoniicola]
MLNVVIIKGVTDIVLPSSAYAGSLPVKNTRIQVRAGEPNWVLGRVVWNGFSTLVVDLGCIIAGAAKERPELSDSKVLHMIRRQNGKCFAIAGDQKIDFEISASDILSETQQEHTTNAILRHSVLIGEHHCFSMDLQRLECNVLIHMRE